MQSMTTPVSVVVVAGGDVHRVRISHSIHVTLDAAKGLRAVVTCVLGDCRVGLNGELTESDTQGPYLEQCSRSLSTCPVGRAQVDSEFDATPLIADRGMKRAVGTPSAGGCSTCKPEEALVVGPSFGGERVECTGELIGGLPQRPLLHAVEPILTCPTEDVGVDQHGINLTVAPPLLYAFPKCCSAMLFEFCRMKVIHARKSGSGVAAHRQSGVRRLAAEGRSRTRCSCQA